MRWQDREEEEAADTCGKHVRACTWLLCFPERVTDRGIPYQLLSALGLKNADRSYVMLQHSMWYVIVCLLVVLQRFWLGRAVVVQKIQNIMLFSLFLSE